MKKIWVLATILVISAVFIIGCSSSSTPTASITPATTTPSATSVPVSTTPAPTSTATTSTPVQTTTTATAKPTTPISAVKTGGTLRFVYWASPSGTGGLPAELFGNDFLSSQLCVEPLIHVDSKGEITPWLAESYKVADDLKSITFTLRKGIKFHDGSDFNAKAAKWNLDNMLATKSQPTWVSIDIIDDYTVRLNLSQWTNTILTGLASYPTYMVSPTAFQKNGADWMRNNPVGTGPFKFVNFQRDVVYKTVKNPDYWVTGKPYLDGVELLYVADPLTQRAILLSGGTDVLQIEPGRVASELQGAPGINTAISVTSTFILMPDTVHPDSPFAIQKVREAVEYAIDREAIAKTFSYGYWQAPYQIPAPSSSAYNSNFTLGRKYDLVKAKQLLSDAGYPNGFKATLLVIPVGIDKNIPLAIQSNLAQINIKLEVSIPAIIPKFLQDSNTMNSALVLEPIFGANWNSALSFALRPGLVNMNQVWLRTPEFIDLYNATLASRAPDPKLMQAATDYLTKGAWVIPVFSGGSGYAMGNYVMDAGWFGRGSDWKPENTWLNK
jgi:peptide/nickel transport system substrate-binding protein